MLTLAPRDLALGCSISLIWGLNFVVIKLALDEAAPMTLMGFRFLIVALAVLTPMAATVGRKHFLPVLILGLLFGVLHHGLMVLGTAQVDAALAAILIQLGVPFALLVSAIADRNFPLPNQIGGVLLAFCGTTLAIGLPDDVQALPGIFLLIGSAMAWAVSNRVRQTMEGVPAVAIVIWSSAVAAPMFLVSVVSEGLDLSVVVNLSWTAVLLTLFLALFSSLYAAAGWWRLVVRYEMISILPFFIISPVLGVVFGVVLLGEDMTWSQFSGVGIAVLGIWLIERWQGGPRRNGRILSRLFASNVTCYMLWSDPMDQLTMLSRLPQATVYSPIPLITTERRST